MKHQRVIHFMNRLVSSRRVRNIKPLWLKARRIIRLVLPFLQLIGVLLYILLSLKNLGWLWGG